MNRVCICLILNLCVAAIVGSTTSSAAIPGIINIQGILRDASNNPMPDATYNVTFRIYTAASGGAELWSEAGSVITTNGLFNGLMGAATPVPDSIFKNPDRWLGIQVQGYPEMIPRVLLSSVGYAFEADQGTAFVARGNWTGEEGALSVTGDKPTMTLQSGPVAGNKKWMLHLGSNGPGNLEFWKRDTSAWTHVMGLTQSGYVGMGTTNPTRPLHVIGSELYTARFENLHTTGAVVEFQNTTSGATWEYGVGGSAPPFGAPAGSMYIHKQGTGYAQFLIEPTGNIRASGKLVPGGEENLRIIRGEVNAAGGIVRGTGFTVVREAVGQFKITFSQSFLDPPSVTASTRFHVAAGFAIVRELTESYVTLNLCKASSAGLVCDAFDDNFHFIAVGAR